MANKSSSAAAKETRKRSWARGEDRKKARVEAQKKREADNKARRGRGEPTPWEAAKAKRAEARRGKQKKAA